MEFPALRIANKQVVHTSIVFWQPHNRRKPCDDFEAWTDPHSADGGALTGHLSGSELVPCSVIGGATNFRCPYSANADEMAHSLHTYVSGRI